MEVLLIVIILAGLCGIGAIYVRRNRREIQTCTRPAPHICKLNGPCNGWPRANNVKWVQTEREQIELGLEFVQECYWKDQEGNFWFNDETQADVCGPFLTFGECQAACTEYAKTI